MGLEGEREGGREREEGGGGDFLIYFFDTAVLNFS